MICKKFPQCVQQVLKSPVPCAKSSHCYERDHRATVSCKENTIVYRLSNPGGCLVTKYHIDNGKIFSADEKKCDYLISALNKKDEHYIFVELKGTNVGRALEQIQETIVQSHLLGRGRLFARIVAQSVPKVGSLKPEGIAIVKWLAKNGVNYRSSTKTLEEPFPL
ncbi:MAG: hypothetical protein IJS52_08515 [Bacilli bacterium]|nr:hypothetical protein [Bacilli bacterium]